MLYKTPRTKVKAVTYTEQQAALLKLQREYRRDRRATLLLMRDLDPTNSSGDLDLWNTLNKSVQDSFRMERLLSSTRHDLRMFVPEEAK